MESATMPKSSNDEIEIVKQAQEGSIKAFNQLFSQYKQFVDNLLITYIKDVDEAKDLTNIVFIKMRNKLNKFTEYNNFAGWLRILTKNTAIDYLRVKNRDKDKFPTTSIDVVTCGSDQPVCENLDTKLEVQKLKAYLKSYPKTWQQVFGMVLEGSSYGEISEALNISTNTIKSIMKRIRPRIIKHFHY